MCILFQTGVMVPWTIAWSFVLYDYMRRIIEVLAVLLAVFTVTCSTEVRTAVYNFSTVKHLDGALSSQQFVDQIGQPALESAQAFLTTTEMIVTKIRVSLWFVFRGPWDRLTSEQLQYTTLWLLVSNGTHQHAPLRKLSLRNETLPTQISGRGESLRLDFELNDTTTTLFTQNLYYLYPVVPVPRNYDPLHATETRVYWSQAQRDSQSFDSPVQFRVSLVRDTNDLLDLGAATWASLTDELATAFGGVSLSEAPVLALDMYLQSQEERPGPVEPIPESKQPITVPNESTMSIKPGVVITLGIFTFIALCMITITLVIWKRIRDGNRDTKFARFFDGIARCTGYDPSGFANIDPPDVKVMKERNALIGMLEAHRYQTVKVVHTDNTHVLLESDSDSYEDMSDSDMI